ncbi:hypothetical protein CRG98_033281 [Punica granatum]|uniref:Uncharacterized protein n=1 Tax=Punica granatum TaxID=22663 RepID=A0A2I0IQN4_PUNGR|nr:hypothetical protein CRG98_033281 [Punica granatum]
MVSITKENLIEPLEIEIAKGPAHCDAIEATDEQPWYEDIKHFLQTGQYPTFANRRDRNTSATRSTLFPERRNSLSPFFRCHTTPPGQKLGEIVGSTTKELRHLVWKMCIRDRPRGAIGPYLG